MASNPAHTARMRKESQMLETAPPPGVTAWRVEDNMDHWHAREAHKERMALADAACR